ncbi:Glycoside hydrolasesuperfamily [Penicillium sp. IBT 31633x]|nr:Glycoside hydrolasesuperfamily [Penicillium sp. IBT 31633x]
MGVSSPSLPPRLDSQQDWNYRYASCQPIESKVISPITTPPYYGQIMVAKSIGQYRHTRIFNISLSENTESAHVIYSEERIPKLLPAQCKNARIERLIGPRSNALRNVTFSGISYDSGLNEDKPAQQHANQVTRIRNWALTIDVTDFLPF